MTEREQIMQDMMKHFQQEKEMKRARYRQQNAYIRKGETLFTGSSLMEQFPIEEMAQQLPGRPVVYNRGIGGDTLAGFEARLDSADAEVRLMNTVYLDEVPERAWECEYSCGAVLYTRVEGEIRYLLTQSHKGEYGLPKGHRMAGEKKEEAALREILEETGIRARLLPGKQWREIRTVAQNDRAVKKITYFLADYEDQEIRVQEEELLGCALVTFEEAMRLPLQTPRVAEILADADAFLRSGGALSPRAAE